MSDTNDYYIIVSYWTGEEWNVPLHTFLIDKDSNNPYKFMAYNFNCESKKTTTNENDYNIYFKNECTNFNNIYICAYFISK